MTTWEEAQRAEIDWWGTCANTFGEEQMQLRCAERMGLNVDNAIVETSGEIVDVGGGPVSLLLKARGWSSATVVDPGVYPPWTAERYAAAGIELVREKAEDWLLDPPLEPDEIWIYNVLQHVDDPGAVMLRCCQVAPVVRVFEWVEFETNEAHIHSLLASEIERWAALGGSHPTESGTTEMGRGNRGYYAVMRRG